MRASPSTAFARALPSAEVGIATPSQTRRRRFSLSKSGGGAAVGVRGTTTATKTTPVPSTPSPFGDGRERAFHPQRATNASPPRGGGGAPSSRGSPKTAAADHNMTVNEGENRIQELERSEFDLKMRIFFLEERLAESTGGGDVNHHYEIANLRQLLEAQTEETSRAIAELEQWREREAKASAELKAAKAEVAALRGEVRSVEVTVSESYASRIALLETELRKAKKDLEVTRQDAKEEIEALHGHLRSEQNWGAAEAAALEREYVKSGSKQTVTVEQLKLVVEKLKTELEVAGTEILKKDVTIRGLKQVLEQRKLLEASIKNSEMETHRLSTEVAVLQDNLARAKRTIDAKNAELVRERRKAEGVAILEAEEIAKLREETMRLEAVLREEHEARLDAEARLEPAESEIDAIERALHIARKQFSEEREVHEAERRRLLGQAASHAAQMDRLKAQVQQLRDERSLLIRCAGADGESRAESSMGLMTPRTQVWDGRENPTTLNETNEGGSGNTSAPLAILRQRISGNAPLQYTPRRSLSPRDHGSGYISGADETRE